MAAEALAFSDGRPFPAGTPESGGKTRVGSVDVSIVSEGTPATSVSAGTRVGREGAMLGCSLERSGCNAETVAPCEGSGCTDGTNPSTGPEPDCSATGEVPAAVIEGSAALEACGTGVWLPTLGVPAIGAAAATGTAAMGAAAATDGGAVSLGALAGTTARADAAEADAMGTDTTGTVVPGTVVPGAVVPGEAEGAGA